MNEVNYQLYNGERLKDLYREAENERLVRSLQHQRNGFWGNARKALRRALLAVGQQLLD